MKKVLLLAALAAAQPINHLLSVLDGRNTPIYLNTPYTFSSFEWAREDEPISITILTDFINALRANDSFTDNLIRTLHLEPQEDGQYTVLWNRIMSAPPSDQAIGIIRDFFNFYCLCLSDSKYLLEENSRIHNWLTTNPECRSMFDTIIKLLPTEQADQEGSIKTSLFYRAAMRDINNNQTPTIVTDHTLITWLSHSPAHKKIFFVIIKLLIAEQHMKNLPINLFISRLTSSVYGQFLS